MPRIWITDEEAIEEVNKYERDMPAVTIEARQFYWTAQYTILVVANILLYFSTFIVTPTTPSNPATLVPPQYKSQVLFIFFFSGFYVSNDV